ncbi:MAG: hypothetical protein IPF52_14395 [Saprospiraceae bacterium]|nr:hypothetical protein [Saprospiraceae bacterium]
MSQVALSLIVPEQPGQGKCQHLLVFCGGVTAGQSQLGGAISAKLTHWVEVVSYRDNNIVANRNSLNSHRIISIHNDSSCRGRNGKICAWMTTE